MTTDKSWVRILIYNDCGTEKFLNVFFPVMLSYIHTDKSWATPHFFGDTDLEVVERKMRVMEIKYFEFNCNLFL